MVLSAIHVMSNYKRGVIWDLMTTPRRVLFFELFKCVRMAMREAFYNTIQRRAGKRTPTGASSRSATAYFTQTVFFFEGCEILYEMRWVKDDSIAWRMKKGSDG